jgi:guanylate kinase
MAALIDDEVNSCLTEMERLQEKIRVLNKTKQEQEARGASPLHVKSRPRRPIVIAGPSGVGKGTLIARLVAAHPRLFAHTVSHTTRSPRPGEVDGGAYHFTSRADFARLVEAGGFVEHAEVHGNLYGTSREALRAVFAVGASPVLDVDLQGAAAIHDLPAPGVDAAYVFVTPPSMVELERRLRGRGTDSERDVDLRLDNARREMEVALKERGAWDLVLVNDDVDGAFGQLETFARGVACPPDGTVPRAV